MSYKAYFISVATQTEMQILRQFLYEFRGLAFCNYIAKTTKKITGSGVSFSKGQLVAAITVDRSNLRDTFVNEGNICKHSDMPNFMTVYDIPSKSTGQPRYLKIEPDHKQKEYAEILISSEETADA